MSIEAPSSNAEVLTEPPEIKALREHAQKTVDNDPKLTMLPDDPSPKGYPGQALETKFIESTSLLDSDSLVKFSSLIDPRIARLVETVGANQKQVIENTALTFGANRNVILMTNHKHILDVAYALVATHINLQKLDSEFKSSIIIGNMVAHLGYKISPTEVMPLTEILGLFCDRIYFSYPQTDSTRKTGIDPELTGNHNSEMLKELIQDQKRGNHLLAIAASGTTQSEEVSKGTIGLLQSDYLVIPTNVTLPNKGPVSLDFAGSPRRLETEDMTQQAIDYTRKTI